MAPDTKGEGMPGGWLIGSWEVTGTTANIVLPDGTHHHFDRHGRHIVEVALGPAPVNPFFQAAWKAQADGYWTSFDPTHRPPVANWYVRFVPCADFHDELQVTGHSGDLWWIRRLSKPPGYLNFFVDPRTGDLGRRR